MGQEAPSGGRRVGGRRRSVAGRPSPASAPVRSPPTTATYTLSAVRGLDRPARHPLKYVRRSWLPRFAGGVPQAQVSVVAARQPGQRKRPATSVELRSPRWGPVGWSCGRSSRPRNQSRPEPTRATVVPSGGGERHAVVPLLVRLASSPSVSSRCWPASHVPRLQETVAPRPRTAVLLVGAEGSTAQAFALDRRTGAAGHPEAASETIAPSSRDADTRSRTVVGVADLAERRRRGPASAAAAASFSRVAASNRRTRMLPRRDEQGPSRRG